MKPHLTLVGAGPGDPDLITLKAIKVLGNADVVLYDALANEELLAYCAPSTELIYVGKKGHESGITQSEINELIVLKAFQKGHVVRLKGGDPFIFGRGMEEIRAAVDHGISYAYVPGISSVFAGGAHMIPLTDRLYSDGFWVITGHKSDQNLSNDINLAADSSATIVILMGMSKLAEISRIFAEKNKGETPVAIISNASKHNEKMVVGSVGHLVEMAQFNNLKNPAVIIIGEVVKNHEALQMTSLQFSKHEL